MLLSPLCWPHWAIFDYQRVAARSLPQCVAVAHLPAPAAGHFHRSPVDVSVSAVVAHPIRCYVVSPIAAHPPDADAHTRDPVRSNDIRSLPAVRCVQMSFVVHLLRSQRR